MEFDSKFFMKMVHTHLAVCFNGNIAHTSVNFNGNAAHTFIHLIFNCYVANTVCIKQ